jgi:hypothetical protein
MANPSPVWAAALAGQEGQAWLAQRPADSVIPIILRTRFFDDFLQRITCQDGIRQVVLVAAGLDTRAFRLTWSEQTRLFELNQPSVLQYKKEVLRSAGARPACVRQTIEVDLTSPGKKSSSRAVSTHNSPPAGCLKAFSSTSPVSVSPSYSTRSRAWQCLEVGWALISSTVRC